MRYSPEVVRGGVRSQPGHRDEGEPPANLALMAPVAVAPLTTAPLVPTETITPSQFTGQTVQFTIGTNAEVIAPASAQRAYIRIENRSNLYAIRWALGISVTGSTGHYLGPGDVQEFSTNIPISIISAILDASALASVAVVVTLGNTP